MKKISKCIILQVIKMSLLLTGNFNGEPKDDNLKPDNTAASNTNDLGDSWQVPDPRPE